MATPDKVEAHPLELVALQRAEQALADAQMWADHLATAEPDPRAAHPQEALEFMRERAAKTLQLARERAAEARTLLERAAQ